MKTFTYLIQSLVDGGFYTGISYDPVNRLKEHNAGKIKATLGRRPFKLIYLKEHKSYQEARKHEKWLKKKNIEYKNHLAQLAPPARGGVK